MSLAGPGRVGRVDDLVSTVVAALTVAVTLLAWTPFVTDRTALIGEIVGVLAVVALAGWTLRTIGAPWALVPLGQIGVLLVWSTGRWTPEAAVAGWIPTVESVTALADEVRAGVLAAQEYAAPVPPEVPELVVLLALAAAVCGLLVDLFACTWRVVPLAGLPLLLVYTVPAGLIGAPVEWWVFAATAVGFLILLAREQTRRVQQWGHPVDPPAGIRLRDRVLGSSRPTATGRRIAVLTTGLALLTPWAVPVLSDGLPSGVVGGGGGSSVEITNPMIDLRRDLNRGQDLDLVRITTSDPQPGYLRLAVLDEYDGDAWRPMERKIPADQRVAGQLPRPTGLAAAVPTSGREMTIRTSPSFDSKWLPLPYPVAAARVDGDWRYDRATLDVVSADEEQPTRGLQYGARALDVAYDPDALDQAPAARRVVTDRFLQLPSDLPDVVRDYAREATEGADTPWQQAVRLQNWFQDTDRFTYSLERAPATADDADLVQFLEPGPDGRVGYCEQFAASMALMARSLGIPARVAVGFLRPEATGPQAWTYSAHDMHAWPELYFEGFGWVRFEPTPVSHTSAVPAYTQGAGAPEPQTPEADPTTGPTDAPAPTAAPDIPDATDLPDAADPLAGEDSGSPWPWVLLVVLVLMVLGVTPRAVRRLRSSRRWRAAGDDDVRRAEAAWAEVRDLTVDTGHLWTAGESPRTTGRRLAAAIHDPDADPRACPHPDGVAGAAAAAESLDRIVRAVERARYSPSPVDGGELAADVQRVAIALLAEAGPRERRRATWLPRSLWRTADRVNGRDAAHDDADRDQDQLDRAGV